MALVEFVGQSRSDSDNRAANTSRLLNCYREPADQGKYQIKSVLSEGAWVDLDNVFLRDVIGLGQVLYAVCGGTLYSMTPSGTVTTIGSVTDGDTVLSTNNGTLVIVSGGDYYTYESDALTSPTIGAFDSYGSATFLGQYTIVTEKDGRRFTWSSVADATTFDALDFATKESRDDSILRATTINGRLFLMGERSTEVWYQTGVSTAPFQRLAGGVLDVGLKSYGLLARFDQGAFFIGDDDVAYVIDGTAPRPVSTAPVETALSQGEPTRCFYYEDEGHKFCVIRFTDRPAWVFDLSTLEWHERSKGVEHDPWDAVATVKFDGTWRVGNDFGTIRTLTRGNMDVTTPMRRTMVSRTLYFDGDRRRLAELEVFGKKGYADLTATLNYLRLTADDDGNLIVDGDGNYVLSETGLIDEPRAPHCWIRISGDEGNSWSRSKSKSLGDRGDYDLRTIWRALGLYRQVTLELNCTEPVDIPFSSQARVRIA